MHEYFHIDVNPSFSNDYYEERNSFSERSNSNTNVRQYTSKSSFPRKSCLSRNNTFAAGQKLRESKWFTRDEINIFAAVVESGFIVQMKNEKAQITWGIVMWATGYEKSKNAEHITIYYLTEHKDYWKVFSKKLLDFWQPGAVLKINNYNDKEENPNNDDTIKSKIAYAKKNKLKWHNMEHFVYWCRYLPKNDRRKTESDDMKWFNSKVNIGLMLLKIKKKPAE